jgi:phosphonate transport system ATP-binding protein
MTACHDPLVRVSQLSKSFSGVPALRSVTLDIRPGERVALLGASGSGKSTLLRCLCGLETADQGDGRVEVFGRLLQADGRLGPDIRALRRDIGIVFQQFNLVGRLPLMSNVLAGLSAELPLWRSLLGRFNEQERARALDALDAVGLAPQAFQRASTLSGGQQQRAAIARVLVQGAQLLLADEPVASLDPESTRRVMEQLCTLASMQGMTLVVSLHHVELARLYCQRVVALRQGRLVFDGPTSALTPEFLTALYGSQAEELLQDPPLRDLPVAAAEPPPRPARPVTPRRAAPPPPARGWPWSGLGNGANFTLF